MSRVGHGKWRRKKAVRNGRLAKIRWLARTGGSARLARRMGLGRTPLRRRSDRIEAWVSAGLLAAFLIGAPLAWTGAGRWVYQGGVREQRAQQSWHQTPAVLLHAAPGMPSYEFRLSWQSTVPVPAEWLGPRRQHPFGPLPAPPGPRAGHTVPARVNRS